jgi:hypothetical protein
VIKSEVGPASTDVESHSNSVSDIKLEFHSTTDVVKQIAGNIFDSIKSSIAVGFYCKIAGCENKIIPIACGATLLAGISGSLLFFCMKRRISALVAPVLAITNKG